MNEHIKSRGGSIARHMEGTTAVLSIQVDISRYKWVCSVHGVGCVHVCMYLAVHLCECVHAFMRV